MRPLVRATIQSGSLKIRDAAMQSLFLCAMPDGKSPGQLPQIGCALSRYASDGFAEISAFRLPVHIVNSIHAARNNGTRTAMQYPPQVK